MAESSQARDRRIGGAATDSPPSEAADGAEKFGWTRRHQLALGILTMVFLFFIVVQFIRQPYMLGAPVRYGSGAPLPAKRIDPNVASQASLARLPGIGLLRAEKIVRYRRKHARGNALVFRSASDLRRIRGFGPKITRRLRPFLKFPESSPAPPTQSQRSAPRLRPATH